MSASLEIMILATLVATACAIPGVFLVLRRVALMSDAISHAILLGIVLAFFVVKDISSPWLIIAAAVTGLITVSLTELIIHTRKLKEDAAIGLVFPLLFSMGVILISHYAGDVHLDTQCVLFGEIAFSPFDRLSFHDIDMGPRGIWVMSVVLLLNLAFVGLFYKELKIATFDPGLATVLGFYPIFIHYALMSLTSITAVGAFDSVGSILVVAMMITPPAAAYLLTDRLSRMLILSIFFGTMSALSGYWVAQRIDASIAGSMALMSGVIFLIVFIFAPERGLLARMFFKRWRRWDFATQMLAIHLLQAEITHADATEHVVSHMYHHMLWDPEFTSEVIAQGLEDGLIKKFGEKLTLTPYGREKAKNIIAHQ